MAPRARGNEDKPLLIDAIDKQPVRLDVALAVPAVRSAQGMVTHRLGQGLSAHENLEDGLKLREILSLFLDTLVVLLELCREPQAPSWLIPRRVQPWLP